MPLNYSKWDQLELSDDSDIEGHPNVDKKSLIRWKQRDIHEKREQRKANIAHLKLQIEMNNILLPRMKEIHHKLTTESSPLSYINAAVEQIRKDPSKECPPGNDPSKIEQTYDGMILQLIGQVIEGTKEKSSSLVGEDKQKKVEQALIDGMQGHVTAMTEHIARDEKRLADEEKEQKKSITSDDMHDGFSNKYVPPAPAPAPIANTKPSKPKSKTTTTTEFEVLNPSASSSTIVPADSDTEDDDDALPELSPALVGFSKIPVGAFQKSFEYIQGHRDVVVPGASDALLVAAFEAESQGNSKYAAQCVFQSQLLQYCDQLGKDGVGIFFKRMTTGNTQAERVFTEDYKRVFAHLKERVRINKEEQAAGREQIQLVPESGDTTISFNVPDGPPPEDLRLEGPGTEDMDIEEVRKALQLRWDIFESFPPNLQEALRADSLEAVNEVLGEMDVPSAESIVDALNMGGILNFAEGGVRDQTGADADA